MDTVLVVDWLSLAVRWLHMITGIAWIGSSFYFIATDLALRKAPNLPEGAYGEEWQVHGGGFYHLQKYLVAPAALPEHLTWFKWESYWTWVSGFVLLCLVYYLGADLYLIDPNILDIPVPVAIAISLGSMVFGWFAYNQICKSRFGQNTTALMVLLYIILVAVAWGYTQVFTGRAALLHLGAFTATIMSANVFLVIIPNQKIVVEDLKAGRTPDAIYGQVGKQRSTHNNYLTLPVIFMMLSVHYPLVFTSEYNWIIASLVFLMGVTIRHFFNTMHARKGKLVWPWVATVAIFIAIVVISALPRILGTEPRYDESSSLTPRQQRLVEAAQFEEVYNVVLGRCSMCHATEPAWDGIIAAPKGVKLETEREVAAHAREIYLHAGRTNAMPPANVSEMEAGERALIVQWFNGTTRHN